ncbi:MAG: YggT family protein [Gammaproteobacteria bacterium]
MGGGYFSNAGVFLINAVFGLYILAVLLRFLFQLVRADFYNPLCQAIVTVTNPPLRPMRRYIPALGGLDTSSMVLLLVLQAINTLLVALVLGLTPALGGVLVVAVAELLNKTVWIFIAAVFIEVILSWVAPRSYNPLVSVIQALTAPLLQPVRRTVPPLGALDLSPLIVLLGLQLTQILLVAPLRDLGYTLL